MDFNFCDQIDRIDWHDEHQVDKLVTGWLESARANHIGWIQGPRADVQHVQL